MPRYKRGINVLAVGLAQIANIAIVFLAVDQVKRLIFQNGVIEWRTRGHLGQQRFG